MPREVDPSLNERAFVFQALLEKTRLDGRAFSSFREIHLTFGGEYGVATVRLGHTKYSLFHHFGLNKSETSLASPLESQQTYPFLFRIENQKASSLSRPS